MAAPVKRGLDYYPLSVCLLDEPKLRGPKMHYGYLAVVVFVSLLGQLYRDKGYYIDYRDPDAVIWQVQSDLQGKWQPDYDTVAEVITALVAAKLFSTDLYRRGIITSRLAQKNYYRATVTRKTVDIDDSIWLLSMEEMRDLSPKHCYYQKKVNEPNNGVNQPNNGVNRLIYPQSKVKKSKVKTTITPTAGKLVSMDANERGGGGVSATLTESEMAVRREKYSDCIDLFENIKAAPLSGFELSRLVELTDDYGAQWVADALRIMGDNGKAKISYAESILRRWRTDGREAKQDPRGQSFSNSAYQAEVLKIMEERANRE